MQIAPHSMIKQAS